jgi:hypothetical protein
MAVETQRDASLVEEKILEFDFQEQRGCPDRLRHQSPKTCWFCLGRASLAVGKAEEREEEVAGPKDRRRWEGSVRRSREQGKGCQETAPSLPSQNLLERLAGKSTPSAVGAIFFGSM